MDNSATVLIVDDDAHQRRTLSDILRVKGYAPNTAATGRQALQVVRETTPPVAIIDLRLEDMPGLQVLAGIKDQSPDTQCIVITGHASQGSAIESINLGAYSYLLKPLDIDHLLVTIRRAVEQLEAEQARRESAEQYRTLFERVPIGLYRTDSEGRIADANPALLEMLGYPDIESLRQAGVRSGLVRVQDHQASAPLAVSTGTVRDRETEWTRRDGSTLWVRESAVAVQTEEGELLHYEGAVEDTTERRRAANRIQRLLDQQMMVNRLALALGESKDLDDILHIAYEHVRELMDAGAFIVSFYDPDTLLIHAGYVVIDGVPMDVGLLPPIPLEALDQGTQSQVIHTGEPFYSPDFRKVADKAETEYTIVDGAQVVAGPPSAGEREQSTNSVLCVPMKVEGRVIGVMQVQSYEFDAYDPEDIELLAALANVAAIGVQNAQLLQDLQDQIQNLHETQAQLIQAEKMSAVGQLAGGIAHDFNNILTVIHLSNRMLERAMWSEDPLLAHVQRIQDAEKRGARLTKQLLSFSRQEVIAPRELDLNEVVTELHAMLRRLIPEDIELSMDLADDLGLVHMDPSQVDQVIMNLVVNARDAMPQGGKLTIGTANVVLDKAYAAQFVDVLPGDYAQLRISDTGAGMDASVQAHIFEPFFTTKERGQGTGLGLATVYGIVKQSDGHIEVESKEGSGTTFAIYLPRTVESREEAEGRARTEPSDVHGHETILVVEDNTVVRDLTVEILEEFGYQVLAAEGGAEALLLSKGHEGPIHLLLTDVVMPKMSGRELAERLQPQRPEMRVLYTSGYTDEIVAHRGVLHEGTALLAKPFTLESLTAQVRAVLDDQA